MKNLSERTPIAIVTGVGRRQGIAAAVVTGLAEDGWDVAGVYLTAYDSRMPWGSDPGCQDQLRRRLDGIGRRYLPVAQDIADTGTAARIVDAVEGELGAPSALVLCHTESVASGLLDTAIESFDRHYQVNVRGTWLLIKEFGARFRGREGGGRIVTLTSDHTVGNVPYGVTKAAADRVTGAAAHELAPLGITANAVNPGPIDTGLDAGRAPRARGGRDALEAQRDRRGCGQSDSLPLLSPGRMDQLPAALQQRRVPFHNRIAGHRQRSVRPRPRRSAECRPVRWRPSAG